MNCGPYCLRFVHTQKHNLKLSLSRAQKLCQTDKDGTSVENMVRALERLGYVARVREKMTWAKLREETKRGNDVLVVWWSILNAGVPSSPDGHWSVAMRVRRDELDIYDPDPEQIITLPRKMFESHWYDAEIGVKRAGERKDWIRTAVVARWKE